MVVMGEDTERRRTKDGRLAGWLIPLALSLVVDITPPTAFDAVEANLEPRPPPT